MPIAALPWYETEETRAAHDLLWEHLSRALLRAGLPDVPLELTRNGSAASLLRNPGLYLSQTCGLVAVGTMRERVQVLLTPVYNVMGCEGPTYTSVVVVRADHPARDLEGLRGLRCSINERTSHSGMNSLRALVHPLHRDGRFFGTVRASGSHLQSLTDIAAGRSDVAAVDCVVFELARRHRPDLVRAVRIVDRTPPQPAPPWVVPASWSRETIERIRQVLRRALATPNLQAVKNELLVSDLRYVRLARYEGMLVQERTALDSGYRDMPWRNDPPA